MTLAQIAGDPLRFELALLVLLGLAALVLVRLVLRPASPSDARCLKLCAGDLAVSEPSPPRPLSAGAKSGTGALEAVRRVLPHRLFELYRERLVRAGLRGAGPAATFFAAKAAATIGLAAAAFASFALLLPGTPLAALIGIAAAGAAIGFVLPDILVGRRARRRRERIEAELPFALDLLVTLAEAGLGVDAAFAKLLEGRGLRRGPLRDELDLALREIRSGKERAAALRDVAERTGVESVASLVVALVQAEQLGTGIGTVLRTQSEAIRSRRQSAAEERAMKLPVQLILPLVVCVFPAIFVVTLVPAILRVLGMMSDAMSQFGG